MVERLVANQKVRGFNPRFSLNLKTKDIQDSLAKHYIEKNHNPVCTNFKGAGYAECDVISISNSDYVYEFEVKISRADFKKDKDKVIKHRYLNEAFDLKIQKKRRTRKVSKIPNYFTYVCPTDLIRVDEIPVYAGLIYIDDNYNISTIKKAPILHKDKLDIKLLKRVARTLTERLQYGMALKSWQIKHRK